MTTAPGLSGASIDALRNQIENELRQESRRRRLRLALVLGAVALVASLVLNLLVIAFPATVGIATADQVEAAREEIAATDLRVEETAALTQTAARQASQATQTVPVICSTLAELGDWSFVGGEAPATTCPATKP